ncbi:MAG: hypothetical protein HC888_01105 [Candidatus Competibacteraceae bacterium]|nr:hypothetical protein [Candidatus Competibacteraceae bacterium]
MNKKVEDTYPPGYAEWLNHQRRKAYSANRSRGTIHSPLRREREQAQWDQKDRD